jgi:hypothetical protein
VSLRGDRAEVEVRVEGQPDRTVLGVLDTVERWLDKAGLGWAEMWPGALVPSRQMGSGGDLAMSSEAKMPALANSANPHHAAAP